MASASVQLSDVLLRPDVWQGHSLAVADGEIVESGFPVLDAELPGGGWPRGVLIECMAHAWGIGEVSFLLPALRKLEESAPIAIVAPPGLTHAPAWASCLPLQRFVQVEATGEDIAWGVELLLSSGGVGALLAWLPPKIGNKALRRLQLAAEGHRSLAFMFRSITSAQAASPAPLRLVLKGSPQGMQTEILKRRGPPCEKTLVLPVERPVAWSRLTDTARVEMPAPGRKRQLELVSK